MAPARSSAEDRFAHGDGRVDQMLAEAVAGRVEGRRSFTRSPIAVGLDVGIGTCQQDRIDPFDDSMGGQRIAPGGDDDRDGVGVFCNGLEIALLDDAGRLALHLANAGNDGDEGF